MGGSTGPKLVGAGTGALGGAAAGATLGSVVPGIGTAIGAAGGAIIGGLGGSGLFGAKGTDLPADPYLANQEAAANNNQIAALQTQAQGDTASLMARYGARLALAGTSPPGLGRS